MLLSVSPRPYFDIHGHEPLVVTHLLGTLRNMGMGGIDLTYQEDPSPDLTWPDFCRLAAPIAQELGLGISVHGPFSEITDISATDAATREVAVATLRKDLAETGQYLTQFVYVVHPEPGHPTRQPGDDALRRQMCRQSLRELAPLARAASARLAIENMRWRAENPHRTGMLADELFEIVEDLDPEVVGICFDVGHAYISEKDGLYDAFRRHAARIMHVHLADNHGVDDEHLEPGQGEIDWKRFLSTVRETGYRGMLQLEVGVPDGEDPLAFYSRNYHWYIQTLS